ncbi:lengsin [Emydura macquarii macquarii]|uniref:lengsin n=1 Tax=Emydura macquarii macquarii TaxID=1129001 RepID=UPI00352A95AC
MMLICNTRLTVMNVMARFTGSCHGTYIWLMSGISRCFINGQFLEGWLLVRIMKWKAVQVVEMSLEMGVTTSEVEEKLKGSQLENVHLSVYRFNTIPAVTISNGDLNQNVMEMDKEEDLTHQNTVGNDNDEADGSSICGLRRTRGVKVTAKYILPLECEKMEISHPTDTTDCSYLQSTTGHVEPPASPPLQKPKTQEQKGGKNEHFPTEVNVKENPLGKTEEVHKDDEAGRTVVERKAEKPEETQISSKRNQPLGTEPESKEENCRGLDTVSMEDKSGVTETTSNEDKCGRTEDEEKDDKLYATEKETKGNKGIKVKIQEKGTEESFTLGSGVSKHTLQELKNLLRNSPLLGNRAKYTGKPSRTSSHISLPKSSEKAVDKQGRSVKSFLLHFGGETQRLPTIDNHLAGLPSKSLLVHSSVGSDQQHSEGSDMEHPIMRQTPAYKNTGSTPGIKFNPSPDQTGQSRDPDVNNPGSQHPLRLVSLTEHIKQQMARDNIQFVRFEATDLHGVSRSKSIPSRFFHEKAIYGVSMPRGYLELTLNPKDSEVDHISATNFNCDILLSPDLSTFRVLPWIEQTARVICDSFTVLGTPLLTAPRHIAKQQLSHLQNNGFSLHSAFTYEFCIYGVAEIVNSKLISFPAASILNNHDQSFIQELIEGMYHAGANIESFSSSTGPGQMEICFHPEFGIGVADSAFTFRTGIKEVAKKYNYIASFFTENGFYNSGILSHSLWDFSGQKNLFSVDRGVQALTDIGKNWLAGLLEHSAALSCLMVPAVSCRKRYSKYGKESKDFVTAKWAFNDNSCAFNIKCHDGKGTQIENKLGSATANPYLVLAATIAAGLDGVKRKLSFQDVSEEKQSTAQWKPAAIPLKLEDALVALEEDLCLREALGDTFIRYFVAMKHYELETEETDAERNKFLEYFI